MKYLYFLLGWIGVCAGSKILVVFPVPGKSHGILGESVVTILLGAGHEVTYVSPFPPQIRMPKLNYVGISSVATVLSEEKRPNIKELNQSPRSVTDAQHMGPMLARKTLEDLEVQALLHDPEITFDAVIVEWFFTGLLAPLAEVYGCPLIWYRSNDMCWQSLRMMHEASSPTYSRDLHADRLSSVPFSFPDRIYQTWLQLYVTGWMYYINKQVEIPAYKELYQQPLNIRGKSLPEYDSIVYNASLMFANSHPPLGQKLALPLNVKYIGGHHIELTPTPLSKDLKRVMDTANGVIFFSMGSLLKSKEMSEQLKRSLIEMFSQLEQTVIWKLEEEIVDLPKNVHLVEWAPQQSILNHPNIALFITHGGLVSIVEATHFGVPVIGVPIFADQFFNVDLAVLRGVGIRTDLTQDFPWKLQNGIYEILGNHSYRANAKAASFVFRNRPALPQNELKHWLQLAIDTQGAMHLRSPALQVAVPDRLYLDFLLIFILFLWFLSKVAKIIKVHLTTSDDWDKKNS